jgi:hypothetical protein
VFDPGRLVVLINAEEADIQVVSLLYQAVLVVLAA